MKQRPASYCFLFLVIASFTFAASPVKKGFAALGEYDYFRARKTFYRILKKNDNAYASYGLAVIFSRKDNPFTNFDSAAKYANRSYAAFIKKPAVQSFNNFTVDSASIKNLCDSVAVLCFSRIRSSQDPLLFDHFLKNNYLASKAILSSALVLRDELEFYETTRANHSASTLSFIQTHPESSFFSEAVLLRERQIYNEYTVEGSANNYRKFIAEHPKNVMVNEAYEKLFRIYRTNNDRDGLKSFIFTYPSAPQVNEAWKLLFSLTVRTFSNKELEKFLKEYPSFPFKNSIQKELKLNSLVLYPYEKNESFGCIDTTGKIIIAPEYESFSEFREGLSVVSKNDSVFYVNKENVNPFGEYFSEAYPFFEGVAAVKKNTNWYFINRQGQIISTPYEEINELSSNVYVVKHNGKFGAVNASAQLIIEPRFQKLGDFKNDFAYYAEGTAVGYVSKNGSVHKALYEWISDFSEGIAIVKIAGQFGLINSQGFVILEPDYDLILRAPQNTFILVKENKYGFYNGAGCFISPVAYNFIREKAGEYYSNGNCFRLVKKASQTLMDVNGRQLSELDVFEEVNFASNGLFRVKKNKKFGYADKKLNLVIPAKYEEAGDFSDGHAIVKTRDRYAVIDLQGKEVFSSENIIRKLSPEYFLEGEDEDQQLLNKKGSVVLTGINNIQPAGQNRLIFTLNIGEIRLISN